jgi:hypothetical protein
MHSSYTIAQKMAILILTPMGVAGGWRWLRANSGDDVGIQHPNCHAVQEGV